MALGAPLPSIVVIGELNVDLVAADLESPPTPGHEVLAGNFQMTLGSASAIFACAAAKLGHPVTFISRVGNDFFGQFCIDALRAAGIATDHVGRSAILRTGVTISLSGPNDRSLITYLGTISELGYDDLTDDPFQGHRHLHMTSYFLQRRLRPSFARLFAEAHTKHLTTSFDPNGDPQNQWSDEIWSVLDHTDVLFLNEQECLDLTKAPSVEAALLLLARSVQCVVVKRGAQGAVAQRGDEVAAMPGFKVDAVDTTGAGDTFAGGFISGYLRGLDLARCLEIGNAVGALSTLQLGGVSGQPDAAGLEQFLSRERSGQ